MGDDQDRLVKSYHSISKARLKWLLLVILLCLAYVFFALAFISIRAWLWGSTLFWGATLQIIGWLGEKNPSLYAKLIPTVVRSTEAQKRIREVIEKNRETLEKYGWLP